MAENEPIEAEYRHVDEGSPRRELEVRRETPVQEFNPLDAEPVSFRRQLASRQENYDALAMHLRGVLIPGKDFDRIHIANKSKCPRPWECSPQAAPGHWSDYQLLASGADKILGVLGLAPSYPGEQDFIRAALKGNQILDVIMKCNVLSARDMVVSEGMGACGRDEVNGSLNNAIKRACKRARVDAVHRLPAVSALFEADFLAEVAEAARKKGGNTTGARARTVKNKFDTGATLEVMPIGKAIKGQRFVDMEESALLWISKNLADKPDIHRAAVRELERRAAAADPDNVGSDSGEAPERKPPPRARDRQPVQEQSTADWFADYEKAQQEWGEGWKDPGESGSG